MLKGSRDAVLKKIQPVSIHGQLSLDVHYVFPEDDERQIRVARVGPEAVESRLEPGDHVTLDFLAGVVTRVAKLK